MREMRFLELNWWEFHGLAVVAAAAFIVGVISIVADRRRNKRKQIDDVGFMPWTAITVLSFVIALGSATMAMRIG